jgi:hypothetical protein
MELYNTNSKNDTRLNFSNSIVHKHIGMQAWLYFKNPKFTASYTFNKEIFCNISIPMIYC